MSLTDDMPLKRVELFAHLKDVCEVFDAIQENNGPLDLACVFEAAACHLRNYPSRYKGAFIVALARFIRYLENMK